jgi:hypothetical protein
MQHLYGNFVSSVVQAEQLKALLTSGGAAEQAVDAAFSELLSTGAPGSGTKAEGFGLIVKQVITTYVKNLVKADIQTTPLTVLGVERQVRIPHMVNTPDGKVSVEIGGIIDRIDEVEGRVRIVDYKTGSVKDSFSDVASLFNNGDQARNDAAFQVLVYAMAYGKATDNASITPSLCFVRGSHAPDFAFAVKYGEKKQVLTDYRDVQAGFEELLTQALETLFDPSIPFTQTTRRETCRLCPYARLCSREE